MSTVAELIDLHAREIIETWLRHASCAPAAQGLDRAEVENSMQQLLEALARRLRNPGGTPPAERASFERHLAQRLRLGYTLSQLMNEYTLLWAAIAGTWAQDHEHPLTPGETQQFFSVLHETMSEAVDTFTTQLRDSAQLEKHALRQLDKIAAACLGETEGGRRLSASLVDLLHVIEHALDADHVALATIDENRPALAIEAMVGRPIDFAALAAQPLDALALPSRVAASPEPMSVQYADDQPPRTEPDLTLWRAGIRTVVGQRLWARGRLLGALCVGFERQPSTLWQERRLHTLAERMGLLLENAETHDRLVEKKNELEATVERLREERELRDRFVSVLAHDLRGPLAAAKLSAQMLTDQIGEPRERRKELAGKIQSNIERTDRMIRDLLDANRVHAGEPLALRITCCDLAAIAREVADELTLLHGDRFVVLAPPSVRGYWSAEELRRALWNLTTNAVKYGVADRPITITVTPGTNRVALAVHNAGEPIPPELQAQLFRAFARSASAQASGPRGWGLGLTLVLGCAEAHGGSVEVESSEAEGTTFTMRIPWDARPHRAPAGAAAAGGTRTRSAI
jgi:signal transduction histidine kinase